jgi:ABC-type transporter Mla maintaining outer membrane lipid asymmetry ATPase subunit MlaF
VADSATPLISLVGVEKASPGLPTIRVKRFLVRPGDRFVVRGADAGMAEAMVHLITGAALPDTGEVRLGDRRTRDVSTDTEWLASLDRFGIVTERAVLLDGMTLAANLALPLTLEIDPIPSDVRDRIDRLAGLVGLDVAALDRMATKLSPIDRMRLHLARALAVGPQALLLEHPTASLDPAGARELGAALRRAADDGQLAFVAFSNDDAFAEAAGGRRIRANVETGDWSDESAPGFWRRILPTVFR